MLCLGHTRRPFIRCLKRGLVLNPGSVGKPKDDNPRAFYALVDLGPQPRAQIYASGL
ncbi:hypothetical protein DFAR_2330028 [Desulfarculales bacterium]